MINVELRFLRVYVCLFLTLELSRDSANPFRLGVLAFETTTTDLTDQTTKLISHSSANKAGEPSTLSVLGGGSPTPGYLESSSDVSKKSDRSLRETTKGPRAGISSLSHMAPSVGVAISSQSNLGRSSKTMKMEMNPSNDLQAHSDETEKSAHHLPSLQENSNIDDHRKNLGDKKSATELALRKVLMYDSPESLAPIELSPSDPDWNLIEKTLIAKRAKEAQSKKIWIPLRNNQVCEFEWGRRWKALSRQFEQREILRKWNEVMDQPRAIQRYGGAFSLQDLHALDQFFKFGEEWPTYYEPKTLGARQVSKFLKLVHGKKALRKFLDYMLSEDEINSRMKRFHIMACRSYPHDWLSQVELKESYKQGLDTSLIMQIGNLLQFGRKYFTFQQIGAIPKFQFTYQLILTLWGHSDAPWAYSPEKAWLLSNPERKKLYEDRIASFKDFLKYTSVGDDDLLKLSVDKPSTEMKANLWWNLADRLEWQEYQFDSKTMIQIGDKLNLKADRNRKPNETQLKRICNSQNISMRKRESMYQWFESNSISPYDKLDFENEAFAPPWLQLPEDMKSYLISVWMQGTLWPQPLWGQSFQILAKHFGAGASEFFFV